MSAALLPFDTAADSLPRKKFSREEVERLNKEGFFDGQRYELIDGDLIDKMGQNPGHAIALRRVMAALMRFIEPILVQVQIPI